MAEVRTPANITDNADAGFSQFARGRFHIMATDQEAARLWNNRSLRRTKALITPRSTSSGWCGAALLPYPRHLGARGSQFLRLRLGQKQGGPGLRQEPPAPLVLTNQGSLPFERALPLWTRRTNRLHPPRGVGGFLAVTKRREGITPRRCGCERRNEPSPAHREYLGAP